MALVDIIKYEGDNSTFVWKHPCEDFNSLTQLIVHESQEAVFFMNGQALDLFGAGRYTLETQNIPKLGKLLNRTTGDNTPFHCEVYFINKTVQMAMKWGTDSKVRYIDPESGVPLELGASGSLNMQVADSRKLLIKLVGTMTGIAWDSERDGFTKSIQSSFRPVISTAVKTTLSSVIKALQINILEVDEHLNEIASELHKKISPEFEEYGLSIPQFYLTTVVLPEDDPNFKRIRELYGELKRNPTESCKLPKVIKKEIQPLEDYQVTEFLDAVEGHVHEYLYKIALFTGLRQGELLGLTWDCIDFSKGTLTVKQQVRKAQSKGGEYYFSSTKNSRSRTLSIAPSVLRLFRYQKQKQTYMAAKAGDSWLDQKLVFTNATGGILSYRTVYDGFKRIVRQMGLPQMRFHDLRHSYAVISIKSGDDIKTIQSNLGHSSAAFTLDVYGHCTDEMKKASADRMESYMKVIMNQ